VAAKRSTLRRSLPINIDCAIRHSQSR
jgi:hypothetical protein